MSSTSANAYTVTALAHRFGCDKDTIYALIRSGRLPAFNIAKPGSKRATWRVSASAVDDFDRGQTTTKPPTKRRKSRAKQAADFVRYY